MMTIEEKAKAYDKGIEAVRELLDTMNETDYLFSHVTKEDVRDMFAMVYPELAESEDERIRKGLIEALKASKTVGELKFVLPEPTREECIAYLEKQKEHKPEDYCSVRDEFDLDGNLKERNKENRTIEWGEKEYGRLFDIEHYLDGTLQLSPDRKIACIDFIKSLRPQHKINSL